jgi:hypothetical protein
MAGFTGDTPWTPTQTGYFNSYGTWIYLLEPFLLTLPGVQTREIEPWSEARETWRRLEVTFPDTIASHSRVQTYYFGAATAMQRRVDYSPDVNGRPPAAHYTLERHVFDGLVVPARRRVSGDLGKAVQVGHLNRAVEQSADSAIKSELPQRNPLDQLGERARGHLRRDRDGMV